MSEGDKNDLIKQAARLLKLARSAAGKVEDVQRHEPHIYRHAEVDWLRNAMPEIDAWLIKAGAEPGITFEIGDMVLSSADRARLAEAWRAIWHTAIFELTDEGSSQRIVNSRAHEVDRALRAAKIIT